MATPFHGLPVRYDPPSGPSSRRALVVPGRAYSPAAPLLDLARQALLQHGWTVRQLWWDAPALGVAYDARAWVLGEVDAAMAAERATPPQPACWVLVAKSLGTRAVGTSTDVAGFILLTPLLTDEAVVSDIRQATARGSRVLLVGGAADRLWDSAVARALGCDVLELPGADHALAVEGDAVGTARNLVEVTVAVERFVASLP